MSGRCDADVITPGHGAHLLKEQNYQIWSFPNKGKVHQPQLPVRYISHQFLRYGDTTCNLTTDTSL